MVLSRRGAPYEAVAGEGLRRHLLKKSGCWTALANEGHGLRQRWLAVGPTVGHSEALERGIFMEKFLQRWTKIRP